MNFPFGSFSHHLTALLWLLISSYPWLGAKNYELPIIGECTFSQDKLYLKYKLQYEIEAYPEVIMTYDHCITVGQDILNSVMFNFNPTKTVKSFKLGEGD